MSLPISNTEHVYRQLRHRIITGELSPGERLLIRGLCEQFGTSNSPVIEAIRRLEQEGLVTSRQNAGAQVTEWTSKDVVRSYLTREAVDGMAARLFVDVATQEQRDKLVKLNEDYHQAAHNQNAAQVRAADTAYHLHVISCTLSLPMQKAMESTYAITMTFFSNLPHLPEIFVEDAHDYMTDLLLGDDPATAEEYVRDTMRGALGHLVATGAVIAEDVPTSIELGGSMLMET